MSKIGDIYFQLQEQAEYYGMDLDFETLEFLPFNPKKLKYEWPKGDYDERMDIDRE